MRPPTANRLRRIFSPWVMRTAWLKVQSWYKTGELYDTAEYLAWESDPLEQLEDLAHDLINDTYSPAPFPMVPFPKKGDKTRHYTMPSVRDQVAFMVFAVILGPFYEARMPNVSFGNRLFRPRIHMDGRWYRGPFTLHQPALYEPFSRSYGLFRAHLQRLASRTQLGQASFGSSSDGQMWSNEFEDPNLDQEDPDWLPYSSDRWGKALIYARLDVSVAFPAADRTR